MKGRMIVKGEERSEDRGERMVRAQKGVGRWKEMIEEVRRGEYTI